jgi:RNA recognition motif-containing protein
MNIFVGNLAFTTTDQELRARFEAYGTVDTVRIMTDRDTGRARGFGFVEMPNAIEANAAIAGLDGTALGGRALTVNEARPREERRPRDDGEGRRRPRW